MLGRLHIVVVLILAIGLFAAGCGGDDGDGRESADATGATTAAPEGSASDGATTEGGEAQDGDSVEASGPEAEFIREANAICRKAVARIQLVGKKVFEEESGPKDGPTFKRRLVNDVLVPNLESEVNGLRELEVPPADEAQVNKIITAIEEVIRRVETNPKNYGYYPYVQAERLADAYGLNACGRPSL